MLIPPGQLNPPCLSTATAPLSQHPSRTAGHSARLRACCGFKSPWLITPIEPRRRFSRFPPLGVVRCLPVSRVSIRRPSPRGRLRTTLNKCGYLDAKCTGRKRTFLPARQNCRGSGPTGKGSLTSNQPILRHLRDKLKREVDFQVVRDRKPWFLVEVKDGGRQLSDSLGYFQSQTHARHAFQVVLDRPFAAVDCFTRTDPVVVSARTFLSQLL